MQRTSIEWTTFTANPLKYRNAAGKLVWGCVHASPGCQHCYSEALAKRYGRGGPFTVPVMNGLTPFLDERELHHMLTAKRIDGAEVSGSRCFVGDMTDIFGEWVPDELLDRLFAVLALRHDVTWQVLTKRAERMRAYCSTLGRHHDVDRVSLAAKAIQPDGPGFMWQLGTGGWYLPNVWLGTSVENQQYADERIPLLLQTPAAVRFISAEPLIGPVDLRTFLRPRFIPVDAEWSETRLLDWVIAGGESGPGSRPCDLAWVRSIVEQCRSAGVACFYKQGGSAHRCDHSRKGGCLTCAPEDLRVREFPSAS